MLLALAIVAELPDFAAEVVEVLIRGLELKLFGRADSLPVAEFIIRVYAQWRGLSIQTESVVLLDGHEYGLLLNHLENRKIEGADNSIIKACDYHVSRSKNSTSRVTYEFDDYCYRIYPAEIFAFLKVCEHLNLDFEWPEHPIINTPLARLGQPEKREPDVLLENVLNVLAVIK